MKAANISGGGTKFYAELFAILVLIQEKGWKPDILTGVSAGAYLVYCWRWAATMPP